MLQCWPCGFVFIQPSADCRVAERNEVRDFPQHPVPAPVSAPAPAEADGTFTADVNAKCSNVNAKMYCEKLLLSLPSVN